MWRVFVTAILFAGAMAMAHYHPWVAGAPTPLGVTATQLLMYLSLPLLLAAIEHGLPAAGTRKSWHSWMLHLQLIISNQILAIPIASLAFYYGTTLVKASGIGLGLIHLRLEIASIGALISAFLLSTLISDFFFYWMHRAFHRSEILWQHHKFHHIDPAFDTLTGSRNNWIETLFSAFAISLPVAILFRIDENNLLEAGLFMSAIHFLFRAAIGINHSNIRMQFGWASVLWTSSQTHRIHHSRLPEHFDKNFAASTPIWDILFGTYYHPRPDEFPPTGVEGEKEIGALWEAHIFAFREWWRMAQKARRKRCDVAALSNGEQPLNNWMFEDSVRPSIDPGRPNPIPQPALVELTGQ